MSPLTFDCCINVQNEEELFAQIKELMCDLRPAWNPTELKFNKFTNGITNTVLSVEESPENDKLVFRIYGNCTENIIDRESELENFELLNKFDIAPPIYARFRNGFVVGHLPGETLTTSTVRDPTIIQKFCEKLAMMHKIPIKAENKPFLFSKSIQFLSHVPKKFSDEKKQRFFEENFSGVDFELMLEEINSMISDANQKTQVLCHNDLLLNNILYDSQREEAHIIDYEYMGINYQLFDIGNHFNEYCGLENIDYNLCPNDQEKREFLKTYLTCYLEREPTSDEIEEMLREIPIFEAASHAFWMLWGFVQADVSSIDFDYLDYAKIRYDQYLKVVSKIKNL